MRLDSKQQQQQQQQPAWERLYIKLSTNKIKIGFVVLNIILVSTTLVLYTILPSDTRWDGNDGPSSYDKIKKTNNKMMICPSAEKLFDDGRDNNNNLDAIIEKAKDFHQRGGNLVSIEKYLTGQMQNTLDKLDMKFEFNQPPAAAKNNKEDTPTTTTNDDGSNTKNKNNNKAIDDLTMYYQTHNDIPRGGYGQPLPGKWSGKNFGKNGPLFEQRWINVIEPSTAERFKVSVGPVGPNCSKQIHFAEHTYEEKLFCVPDANGGGGNSSDVVTTTHQNELQTQAEEDQQEECNIFSIGSNDQWGFENEVVQKLPDCVTHTFDCTLKNNTPKKKPNSDNVRFYPYCIGDGDGDGGEDNNNSNNNNNNKHDSSTTSTNTTTTTDDNKETTTPTSKTSRFLPYHELWKQTNTKSPPKLLKIDVEGFEFSVLPSMLRTSPQEIWPEQIMVEIHWGTRMVDVPSMLRTRQASEIALLFGQLFNYGGYLPVNVKYFEPGCSSCMEVLLVRVVCYNE